MAETSITLEIHGGWMPDLEAVDIALNKGLARAEFVLPVDTDYFPVKSRANYCATACSGTPLEGYLMQDVDGSYYNFIMTTSNIYRFSDTSMTQVTRTGGASGLVSAYSATLSWDACEFGSWVVMTDYVDDVQVIKGPTSNLAQNLGGSPPKAKFCIMNNGHLMLANVSVTGTSYPKEVHWSANEDVETWTPSLETGAGSLSLSDTKGTITGIMDVSGRVVVLSENSVSIGDYVGGTLTYRFRQNIADGIGCYYPYSSISVGPVGFFWGKDTVWQFDGQSFVDIGRRSHIAKTVFSNVSRTYEYRLSAAHDRNNGLIYWLYTSTASTGTPDKMLVYNYKEGRFTHFDYNANMIMMINFNPVTNLTDAAAVSAQDPESATWGSIYTDSSMFYGTDLRPCVFYTDLKPYTLTGNSIEQAVLETGDVGGDEIVACVHSVNAEIKGNTIDASVTVNRKYNRSDTKTSSPSSNIKRDNYFDVRTSGKFLSFKFNISNFDRIGKKVTVGIAPIGGR